MSRNLVQWLAASVQKQYAASPSLQATEMYIKTLTLETF
jgi:hypothetical protein